MNVKVHPSPWFQSQKKWFPKHEMMTALGIVYPQFWASSNLKAKASFYSHLNVLKAIFCVPRRIGLSANIIFALLDTHTLDLQPSHFKMTMIHNSKVVMCDQENNLNPSTQLRCKVTTFPILNQKLSEYMKLAEIAVIQVLSFIENKCTFSTLSFMKNQLWNQLNTHVDLCT